MTLRAETSNLFSLNYKDVAANGAKKSYGLIRLLAYPYF
jgi:hypothetical protein